MSKPYSKKHVLTEPLGNNAFAWQKREALYGHSPTLSIPSLIDGTLDDINLWEDIVFEEMEDGVLRSCKGLQNFVRISESNQEILIFDNHNHALYFWIDAVRRWIIEKWFDVIHIDEHSDLWDNPHELQLERAIWDESYAWDFTNLYCNVGNYIQPALRCGLVANVIRIENEYQIDEYIEYNPQENTILNIDIDIFAPELDHIPKWKKIQIIKNLLKKVKYVTIATSPYFIDQWKAIQKLHELMKD